MTYEILDSIVDFDTWLKYMDDLKQTDTLINWYNNVEAMESLKFCKSIIGFAIQPVVVYKRKAYSTLSHKVLTLSDIRQQFEESSEGIIPYMLMHVPEMSSTHYPDLEIGEMKPYLDEEENPRSQIIPENWIIRYATVPNDDI